MKYNLTCSACSHKAKYSTHDAIKYLHESGRITMEWDCDACDELMAVKTTYPWRKPVGKGKS